MTHPYKLSPSYTRWSRAVTLPSAGDVDPVVEFPLKIKKTDRIVTAGSCFAQHIAHYLSQSGFNHFIAEKPHPMMPNRLSQEHNYGIFSARYGNIYTSRQLFQLIQRALGEFEPEESIWRHHDYFVDPFRPAIQPGGFKSISELEIDRAYHLSCVLDALKSMNIFIFTLGLTETWVSAIDGAAFPLCPGVAGGSFDPVRYKMVNLKVDDVVKDLESAINAIRKLNKNCQVVLTVSPVPLAATAEDRHVLVSTTLSKSVLRVAAEQVSTEMPNVHYFPSYEIITGAFNRGNYFAKDLRSVTDQGVYHVMRLFLKHAAGVELQASNTESNAASDDDSPEMNELDVMEQVTEVICEEAMLDL